jgi:hypothetical protein
MRLSRPAWLLVGVALYPIMAVCLCGYPIVWTKRSGLLLYALMGAFGLLLFIILMSELPLTQHRTGLAYFAGMVFPVLALLRTRLRSLD